MDNWQSQVHIAYLLFILLNYYLLGQEWLSGVTKNPICKPTHANLKSGSNAVFAVQCPITVHLSWCIPLVSVQPLNQPEGRLTFIEGFLSSQVRNSVLSSKSKPINIKITPQTMNEHWKMLQHSEGKPMTKNEWRRWGMENDPCDAPGKFWGNR